MVRIAATLIVSVAADSCRMHDGDCGSGSCLAGSGQSCHDCGDTNVCCVNPAQSNNCNYGHGCGSGNCVASAGQTCSDCSNKRMCAVCSSSVTREDALAFLNSGKNASFIGTSGSITQTTTTTTVALALAGKASTRASTNWYCHDYYGHGCGSGSCTAGSGQTCFDCSNHPGSGICCVDGQASSCRWSTCGSDCIAGGGQTCHDCSSDTMCAVCTPTATLEEAKALLHNATLSGYDAGYII